MATFGIVGKDDEFEIYLTAERKRVNNLMNVHICGINSRDRHSPRPYDVANYKSVIIEDGGKILRYSKEIVVEVYEPIELISVCGDYYSYVMESGEPDVGRLEKALEAAYFPKNVPTPNRGYIEIPAERISKLDFNRENISSKFNKTLGDLLGKINKD